MWILNAQVPDLKELGLQSHLHQICHRSFGSFIYWILYPIPILYQRRLYSLIKDDSLFRLHAPSALGETSFDHLVVSSPIW
jgi:hypothetical protein